MAAKTWTPLVTGLEVPAKPQGRWTLAVEYVGDKQLLKIEAADSPPGRWGYAPGDYCGPDGDPASRASVPGRIMEAAPLGALIGKVGGSTAGHDPASVFLVGSFCLLRLADGQEGPLFLTINDSPEGMIDNKGSIKINVSVAL